MPAGNCTPDILHNIFLIAVLRGKRYPSRSQAPLNISHTCRHWRNVAISSPLLWTYLNLELLDHDAAWYVERIDIFKLQRRAVKLLNLWLSRTGTLPLNFRLKEEIPSYEFEALLLVQQARWNAMEIHWHRELLLRGRHSFKVSDLRCLSHLSIIFRPIYFNGEDVKEESQRTVKQILQFPHFPGPYSHVIAPILTDLKVENLIGLPETPREVLLPMLQHSPNLEKLFVHFCPGFELDFVTFWYRCDGSSGVRSRLDRIRGSLVNLHRLTSLTFLCHNSPHTNLLAHLRVPALQYLSLGEGDWIQYNEDMSVVDDICEMLDNSKALKSLRVDLRLHSDEWNLLLKSAREVEMLEYCAPIQNVVPPGIVLSILNASYAGSRRCDTKLKNLKCFKGDLLSLARENGLDFELMVDILRRYFDNGGNAVMQLKEPGWNDLEEREAYTKNVTICGLITSGRVELWKDVK